MGRAIRWLKELFGMRTSAGGWDRSRDKASNCYWRDRDELCHNPATIPPNISAEAAWLRSGYMDTKYEERRKHAVAVAEATAAAADAAVPAAQAAVAVVRLTGGTNLLEGLGRQRWAAMMIQSVFRGYLARKALRALKGLVKIQALVRGYLVRKQTIATFQGMRALLRAQASVKACRYGRTQHCTGLHGGSHAPAFFRNRARSLMEKFEETRSPYAVSTHSRRLSASLDPQSLYEASPKVVEVDTETRPRSRSRSRRSNTAFSDTTEEDPTSMDPVLTRLIVPSSRVVHECYEQRPTTAQSTPRLCTWEAREGVPVGYMARTASFKAKQRSQSTPKQRTEQKMQMGSLERSRGSLSGLKMQKSCARAQDTISFKNAVISRLGGSGDFDRETEKKLLFRRKY